MRTSTSFELKETEQGKLARYQNLHKASEATLLSIMKFQECFKWAEGERENSLEMSLINKRDTSPDELLGQDPLDYMSMQVQSLQKNRARINSKQSDRHYTNRGGPLYTDFEDSSLIVSKVSFMQQRFNCRYILVSIELISKKPSEIEKFECIENFEPAW